jgi:hypothetical protein
VASAGGHSPRYQVVFGPEPRSLSAPPWRRIAADAGRYLGAVSLLLVGAVHAQQYYEAYFYVVPTIGTLFLLSFIGAAGFAAILFAPVRHFGRRWGDPILVLAALGGIGIAVGTFVSLLVSEYAPLFGFMESGYRLAVVLTLVFDVTTTALLGLFVALVAPRALRDVLDRKRAR